MRSIRTMRGQTRAQLIIAEDGQYVVKYSNNPIGRRVLVNELIASLTLKHLGIRTPNVAFISVDEEVLANNPEIGVVAGTYILPPPVGLHFGCRYAGSNLTRVYDFLPDKLLPDVINRNDFLGALALDQWVSNADIRQAIFYRKNATPLDDGKPNGQWIAEMIDQDSTFDGQAWAFRNPLPKGLYQRPSVYGVNPTMRDFEPWLERIEGVGAGFFKALLRAIPPQWIPGDEEQVSKLMWKLEERRPQLPGLLEKALMYIQPRQGRGPVAVEEFLGLSERRC
jgi:hypothetical protein